MSFSAEFGTKIDGTGLDWFCYMYQGHLFHQKDTYARKCFTRFLKTVAFLDGFEVRPLGRSRPFFSWPPAQVLDGSGAHLRLRRYQAPAASGVGKVPLAETQPQHGHQRQPLSFNRNKNGQPQKGHQLSCVNLVSRRTKRTTTHTQTPRKNKNKNPEKGHQLQKSDE